MNESERLILRALQLLLFKGKMDDSPISRDIKNALYPKEEQSLPEKTKEALEKKE